MQGQSDATGQTAIGVEGTVPGKGWGVIGESSGGTAVYGDDPTGIAGAFDTGSGTGVLADAADGGRA